MNSPNLCFCREETMIHDVMMETTDESKIKESIIGLSSIIGEMRFNHKSMAARLDVLEDSMQTMKLEIKILVKEVNKLQDKIFTGKETRVDAKNEG